MEFRRVRPNLRRKPCRAPSAALVVLVWATLPGAGNAQQIVVQNGSGAPFKITAAEIAALPHQKISVDDHGRTVRFEGVALRLVLEKAGVALGSSLRGKRLSSCLLVEAADGYRVVFALPELDTSFTDRVVLLADQADGHPLSSKEGPFRIIVPGDKIMARWVREVTTLKIVHAQ
jgi:hypothetical protein